MRNRFTDLLADLLYFTGLEDLWYLAGKHFGIIWVTALCGISLFLSIWAITVKYTSLDIRRNSIAYVIAGDHPEHFNLQEPSYADVKYAVLETLDTAQYDVITFPHGYWIVMRVGDDEITIKVPSGSTE